MTKLERQALKYRIDLSNQNQPDQQSVTSLVALVPSIPAASQTKVNREAERRRLESEFAQAKQRLNSFLLRERDQRRAERLAGRKGKSAKVI